MEKGTVKEVIKEFQESGLPEVLPREIEVPLSSHKIIAIVGPRRSGKTYLLFLLIKKLHSRNISPEQIVYINFEDPRLLPCDAKGMEFILEAYGELYPESRGEKSYFFFDEIHNVKDWEIGVRRIHDTKKCRIFLTGSSSKLMSREIATQLRGRTTRYEVFPFSFREILSAKGIQLKKDIAYSMERFSIKNYLDEYLTMGGFPEIVLEESQDLRMRILKEYLETMFFRDLVERHRIRNQPLLRELMKFLATNTANIFSANAYFKWTKNTYPLTKRTLLNYIGYLEDTGLFFLVRKFSFSLKEQTLRPRKCYIIDNGLRTAYGFKFSEDKGKNLENAVFIELLHRKATNPLAEIFYWQDHKKREVDFVVRQGRDVRELIQVCDRIDDFRVKEREIRALTGASEELRCDNLSVITFDYEKEETISGKKVVFKPLWKWLIEGDGDEGRKKP
ncbi:MAG: ATP-binding protein [Candidatus Aminicenantales bacterium]